ncbi:hypothetical protein BZG36_00522 [Bifiguratus adelaidae]|uniref:L-type lectin-like domain-containing protein n=1 Tax=Bifiguratus adelaidae TaxID=1938954 RepID=A0A261Y7J5_9FUNG|nr:hypothetical protein BZG36_00522 [Bifiguratus adelaidae]
MPYIDQEIQSRWFDFGGDTVINTNAMIRLTGERQSQSGWLWSRLPITAQNFQVEFEFKIHGSSNALYGDGMAMWISKQRAQQGKVFGSIDNFEGLGIFFDTYANNRRSPHSFPFVMAMLGDGSTAYDHENDGSANEVASCSSQFRSRDDVTKGRLTYYKDNYLKFELQTHGNDRWDECFRIDGVTLPPVAYLGFTAHTGEVTDNHDIISVTTSSLPPVPKVSVNRKPPPKLAKSGSVVGWMLKLGGLGLIAYGVRFAYTYYKDTQNKKTEFRF